MKMFPRQRNSMNVRNRKGLVQVQKEMLNKILGSSDTGPNWKILVFDSHNQNIISSHFKMKDLRDHNITLYLSIRQERQQIHGVTILYLVEPTIENIQIISGDLLHDLYTSVQIHFSSQPSPNILSTLAKKITQSKKNSLITRISKIEYSCLGYFSIDNSMAILRNQSEIINLLTSLSLTPIFIYNPKSEGSKALVERIKSQMQPISNGAEQKPQRGSSNYAHFYIFNREDDPFPLLSHGITYASLLQNIYQINQLGNKVNNGKKDKKSNELSLQDEIWVEKKNYLISEMGLDKQSNQIKAKMMGKTNEQLTELSEKSNKIEWHVNNAGQMITEAKQRRLIQFYDIEKEIYSKRLLSKDSKRDALILLKQGPNSEDKTRLMLIYIHFMDSLDDLPELETAYPGIKNCAKYNELKEKRLKGVVAESATNKYFKKFAKGILKNLVADDEKFNITKEVEKINKADFAEMVDAGLAVECIGQLPNNIKISRSIVYCLGGACFHEYANIIKNDPDCIYSGDKMVSFRNVL